MVVREFFKDPWTYIGSMGASMIVAVEWITTHFNPIMGLVAGLGGLILVGFGIREKYEKLKFLKKENRLKDLEIEKERAEIERWRNQ